MRLVLPPHERGQRRALVVDDIAENRHLLAEVMTGAGFEVREASGGAAAVEECGTFRPHIVLMDLQMPDVDGLEATRRIRALEGGSRRTPVIAVSASAFELSRRKALDAGADSFVAKPFRNVHLLTEVGRLLGVKWVEREPGKRAWSSATIPRPTSFDAMRAAAGRLPEELLEPLRRAIITCDIGQLEELVAKVAEREPELARGLAPLIEQFDFDAMAKALG